MHIVFCACPRVNQVCISTCPLPSLAPLLVLLHITSYLMCVGSHSHMDRYRPQGFSKVSFLFRSCLAAGVSRQQAQGQGIWSMFQLPPGRGKPEELYGHPIRENLEFSVVAIGTAKQQCLSLTFRCVKANLFTLSCSVLSVRPSVCPSVCLSVLHFTLQKTRFEFVSCDWPHCKM